MFMLAHLSDWHIASRPRPLDLTGKRGLGYINWQRGRKRIHRPEILDSTIHDLKSQATDHVAVTGDLVNLSLPDEYNRARGWLETLGPPRDVTVVPGNHDIYVRSVTQSPAQYWGDYMRGDDGVDRFRYLRRLTDADDLHSVLAEKGAELLLHGHDHCRSVVWLDGPGAKIAAVGVP